MIYIYIYIHKIQAVWLLISWFVQAGAPEEIDTCPSKGRTSAVVSLPTKPFEIVYGQATLTRSNLHCNATNSVLHPRQHFDNDSSGLVPLLGFFHLRSDGCENACDLMHCQRFPNNLPPDSPGRIARRQMRHCRPSTKTPRRSPITTRMCLKHGLTSYGGDQPTKSNPHPSTPSWMARALEPPALAPDKNSGSSTSAASLWRPLPAFKSVQCASGAGAVANGSYSWQIEGMIRAMPHRLATLALLSFSFLCEGNQMCRPLSNVSQIG